MLARHMQGPQKEANSRSPPSRKGALLLFGFGIVLLANQRSGVSAGRTTGPLINAAIELTKKASPITTQAPWV